MLFTVWQTHVTLPLALDTAHQTLAAFLRSTNLARLAASQAGWLGRGRMLGKRWQTHQSLPLGLDTANQTRATRFSSLVRAKLAAGQAGWFGGCRGGSGPNHASRLLVVRNLVPGADATGTTERCGDRVFRTRRALCRSTLRAERSGGTTLAILAACSGIPRKAGAWWNNAIRGRIVWNERLLALATDP